MEGGKDVMLQH